MELAIAFNLGEILSTMGRGTLPPHMSDFPLLSPIVSYSCSQKTACSGVPHPLHVSKSCDSVTSAEITLVPGAVEVVNHISILIAGKVIHRPPGFSLRKQLPCYPVLISPLNLSPARVVSQRAVPISIVLMDAVHLIDGVINAQTPYFSWFTHCLRLFNSLLRA